MKRLLLLIPGIGLVLAGPAILLTATLITFILPESFASTARLKVSPPGLATMGGSANLMSADRFMRTEVETIKSEIVLTNVIHELNLTEEWGRRYAGGMPLRLDECLAILGGRVEGKHVPGTDIMEILAYSETPVEAAGLANAVATAYLKQAAADTESDGGTTRIRLIQSATPTLKPAKPNKPFNILLGAGIGLAVMALGSGLIVMAVRNRTQAGPQTP